MEYRKKMEPFVSVIIPIRNEEKRITECLDSILEQTYPKDHLELLLIDGLSEDNTRKIIKKCSEKCPYIKLYENPGKIVPTGLNIGIKASKGDFIIRMDAHTYYNRDYIRKCVDTLKNIDAYNVGGSIVTLPGAQTLIAKGIALGTSHLFGVGNSKFRTSNKAEFVDTVTFGAFKREIFDHVGLFNEKLVRNQDIELNSRIRSWGGKIYLNPEIKSYYYNKSTLKGLWKQNFGNGKWNIYTLSLNKKALSYRHFIPLIFILCLIAGILLFPISSLVKIFLFMLVSIYLSVNIFCSLKISLKKNILLFPILISVFFVLHISYALGSIWGLLTLRNLKESCYQ